jgi:hypothetical protein
LLEVRAVMLSPANKKQRLNSGQAAPPSSNSGPLSDVKVRSLTLARHQHSFLLRQARSKYLRFLPNWSKEMHPFHAPRRTPCNRLPHALAFSHLVSFALTTDILRGEEHPELQNADTRMGSAQWVCGVQHCKGACSSLVLLCCRPECRRVY